MAAVENDGELIESLNVAGFMFNTTRTSHNGKIKFQFMAPPLHTVATEML